MICKNLYILTSRQYGLIFVTILFLFSSYQWQRWLFSVQFLFISLDINGLLFTYMAIMREWLCIKRYLCFPRSSECKHFFEMIAILIIFVKGSSIQNIHRYLWLWWLLSMFFIYFCSTTALSSLKMAQMKIRTLCTLIC